MSRTYRNAQRSILKRPRGHRSALRYAVRPGAVPPSHYDDVVIQGDVEMPRQALKRMLRQGWQRHEAIRRIKSKFKLPHSIAEDLVRRVFD